MRVIIVGAGIGGLTTALSLRAAGINATLFEAAPRIGAPSLGINLQPTAVRELAEMGLLERLAEVAAPIEALRFFNRHGQEVWAEPRGLACGFRWPQYAVNRGALQALLHQAVCDRLGRDRVIVGHALAGFEQDGNGVLAHFIDPASGKRVHSERGDVLVGADGLHSAVRRHYYPDQALRFAGQLMWRGLSEGPAFLGGRTMVIAGHRNQKFLAYSMGPAGNGREIINWVAELGQSGGAPPREDWNRSVDKSVFSSHFAGWRFGWLDAPAIIDRAEVVLEFPKFDRDPVDRWSFGRVTLLGDAAHPMQPAGSQAGSQAILDARVLAWHLAKAADDVQGALRTYEADRLPVTRDIALQNRAMGAEAMMDIAEERAPQGFADIEPVLPRAEREEHAAAYRRLSGLEVEGVNTRPSYDVLAMSLSPPA
ncbi:flavin-dependent oxidoreductase [Belnapia sp. T6]|uniref:Flavin-dependent oxidoreductase n=1 Tax=Belnapia mucosa TaxID=2804532 RepID=A0ABS1VB54_9PROT|nr:flavin-dependent oxidoreductase [Belnapia mucosa]MBL6458870.1 flavin-dependent oxidoreductase [Belnapia mucosa]